MITNFRRRKPKQRRAHLTCELILDATAQILERKGEATLTTDRIAERAGVSIGTLYQYFPDKNAVMRALARREMLRVEQNQRGAITGQRDEKLRLRDSLHSYIHALKDKPRTRKALLRTILSTSSPAEIAASADQTARMLPRIKGATSLDGFILSRAVSGIVRAAVLEDHPKLYEPEFERAIMRLIAGYEVALQAK